MSFSFSPGWERLLNCEAEPKQDFVSGHFISAPRYIKVWRSNDGETYSLSLKLKGIFVLQKSMRLLGLSLVLSKTWLYICCWKIQYLYMPDTS